MTKERDAAARLICGHLWRAEAGSEEEALYREALSAIYEAEERVVCVMTVGSSYLEGCYAFVVPPTHLR